MPAVVSPPWRVEAERLVPEVFRDPSLGSGSDRALTPRDVLWALLPMTRGAYHRADVDFVARAFAFATWCNAQDDPELYNPAAIGFLAKVAAAHIGGDALPLSILADHLSLREFSDLEELFNLHYGADSTAEVKRLVQDRQVID